MSAEVKTKDKTTWEVDSSKEKPYVIVDDPAICVWLYEEDLIKLLAAVRRAKRLKLDQDPNAMETHMCPEDGFIWKLDPDRKIWKFEDDLHAWANSPTPELTESDLKAMLDNLEPQKPNAIEVTAAYEFAKSTCKCGHTGDGPYPYSEHKGINGHGACRVLNCDCAQFTWKEHTKGFKRHLIDNGITP